MSDCREHPLYPRNLVHIEGTTLVLYPGDCEEQRHPGQWAVCPVCQGAGSHVNPSIDSHGISQEEFDEDPDFREAYLAGQYDVTCTTCKGRTTILKPSTDAGKEALADLLAGEAEYQAEEAAERRMGA